jgi:long-subunit fatty acid transport protein
MIAGRRAISPSTMRTSASVAVAATSSVDRAVAVSVARALTSALMVASVSPAAASPRSDPTSGRAVFTGAATVHPTSVTVNPATVGIDAAVNVYVAYLASTLVLDHEKVELDPSSGEVTGDPSISELRASPGGELSVAWNPTQRISVAVGLRSAPAETFSRGDGTGHFHGRGGQQRDFSATIAGALRASSIFYVGAALSLSRADLHLRFSRDTALDSPTPLDCDGAPCGIGNLSAAEQYDIDVAPASLFSNQNLALTLGLALKLGTDTYVGVAYHTPPGFAVQTSLGGDATVIQPSRVGGTVAERTVKGKAAVDVSYPASVEAGLRTPVARDLLMIAGLRWEDTSRLSGYDVRPHGGAFTQRGLPEWIRRARGLSDAFSGWAGVEQVDRGESWRLGARLGYELASLEDDRVSLSGNSTGSATLDLGAQWRLSSAPWSLQLSYGLAYFIPVSVGKSAFSAQATVDCVASGYDYASDACTAVRNGYGIESGAGDYQRFQHAFRLGARYEF